MSSFTYWRWPISFFADSYTVISACCILNLMNAQWSIQQTYLNSFLSIILMIFIALYPFGIQKFLYNKRDQLKKSSFKERFSTAYEGLDHERNGYLIQPFFFFFRRLLLVAAILCFNQHFQW